jgi:alkylation response protein AidB-like acyl-CoA dehydrogenase
MHFDLNDDQRAIRETARALLEQRSTPARVRQAAEDRRQDEDLSHELYELGWAGISIPEDLDGQGLGLVELCVLAEELGAALAPTPLVMSTCAAQIILRGGTAAQQERWLPGLATGQIRGAVAFEAHGELWAAGGLDADVIVVADPAAARILDPGECRIVPAELIDPLRSHALVEGNGESLLGDSRRGVLEAAVVVGAELLGVARRSLEMTLAYVKERRQFGVPVGSFQAVGHKCAEMLLHVESARSAVYYAAWVADAAPEQIEEAASLAKYVASQAAIDVTAAAIQAHGGVGFTWEADLHWWFKRAQTASQLLGGAAVHREHLGQLVAERASAPAA